MWLSSLYRLVLSPFERMMLPALVAKWFRFLRPNKKRVGGGRLSDLKSHIVSPMTGVEDFEFGTTSRETRAGASKRRIFSNRSACVVLERRTNGRVSYRWHLPYRLSAKAGRSGDHIGKGGFANSVSEDACFDPETWAPLIGTAWILFAMSICLPGGNRR